MAQFAVHSNLNPKGRDRYPFLLDIQSEFLDSLDTRLVIPLIPLAAYEAKPIKELMPIITVKSKNYIVMTALHAGIRKRLLGKAVADVSAQRQEIISSIDFLITGF